MASSVHRLLMSVNAVHKDFAVGRFKVPAAGTNAARNTARGRNWFSRIHPAGQFLELRGAEAPLFCNCQM